MSVLMALLKEPIFTQLRTKEQLGYIVQSGVLKMNNIKHIFIVVQSSTKNAEFLEHRINTLLASLKVAWPFNKKDVKKVVDAKISHLLQKTQTLSKEFQSHWNKIVNDIFEWDTKRDSIDKYSSVTLDDVRNMFDLCLFECPRRLNYKAHRFADVPDAEMAKLNREFYSSKLFAAQGKRQMEVKEITNARVFQAEHGFW
jgi:insulysin